MTGYEYIVQILKQEGTEWLFCFPSNPIIDLCALHGIRPVMFRHERGAVMAADGFSRTSHRERFGVVAVQSQAGAENSVGGLAQAGADNVPLLFLVDGNPLNRLTRPNFSAERVYPDVAKSVERVLRVDDLGSVMRRAFHALRSGPPGPAVVELSADVCAQEVPADAMNYRSPRPARPVPAATDVAAAAALLRAAERPLIWAGGGVLAAGASAELTRLAELLPAPVFCTMPGKSAIDESHPLALGAGSGATTLPARRWLTECDVLLALGTSLTRTFYAQPVPAGAKLIHNSINHEDINKDEAAQIGLVGDAKLTLQALIAELADGAGSGSGGGGTGGGTGSVASAGSAGSVGSVGSVGSAGDDSAVERLAAEVAAVRTEWMAKWEPILTSDEQPLGYYRVVHALNEVLDRDASIVTHDAGRPRDCMVPFYRATTPYSYVGWGKTTHLGFGLPLVIGAKLAHPDRFCLNVMGDAAFGMSGLDLETAVRAQIPITTVLLRNRAMATYAQRTDALWQAALAAGVGTVGGDYAALAESLGATGIRVLTVPELHAALERAQRLNADGTTVLIDVESNLEARRSP